MLVDLIQTTYVKKGNDPHWSKSKTIWIIEEFYGDLRAALTTCAIFKT